MTIRIAIKLAQIAKTYLRKETRQIEGWIRQRPQQGGRYPFVRRLNGYQPL
jgi:hypothetical protein